MDVHEHTHDHDEHNHDHDHDHAHDHTHGHEVHEYEEEEKDLAAFRADTDEFMRDDPHSPLQHEQRHAFQGLSYYPFDPALHIHAPLDRDVSDEPIVMETSTGEQREYRRAGKIHFEVNGQPATLTIYRGPQGELFLPLRDATSGNETYGAGRYLEPEMIDEDTVHADFNYLYNPYCAYNEAWSCPLPPMENWLRVPIRAGEKTFHQ